MRRSVLFIVLVFMLALVGACVESDDDDADDTEDDSAAVTETETAEPTEEATATPEPTEEPEATEEPAATEESEETATPESEETATEEPEETATAEPDDDADDGEEHVVEMQDNFFEPEELEIAAGDTVRFVNEGRIVHTSTLDPEIARDPENAVLPDGAETWDSGDMEPGDEFTVTLDVPGEYVYFCQPHEALGMVGTIIVTDGEDGGMDGDSDEDDDSEEDEDDG